MSNVNKPILSIGMIVKNEERCLEKCLKALQPLRDKINCELIIADTGSTDKTKEIASKYADILFDFEWIDDFSAARNAVMDRCSGKWFLSIDADEYMDKSSVDELFLFLNAKDADEVQVAYVVINNYIDANNLKCYVKSYGMRLCQITKDIRFVGKIHEKFDGETIKTVYFLEKTIFWHDGYIDTKENSQEIKKLRNIELLKKELEENPNNLYKYIQMIESNRVYKDRYKYVIQAIGLINRKVEDWEILGGIVYRHAVLVSYLADYPEFQKWIDESFEKYPNSIYVKVDVNFCAVQLSIKNEDYNSAIKYSKAYLQALKDIKKKENYRELIFSVLYYAAEAYRELVIMNMALAYAKIGKYNECEKILRKYSFIKISSTLANKWLDISFEVCDKIDIKDIFNNIGEIIYNNELDEDDNEIISKRETLELNIKKQLSGDVRVPIYSLIAELGDCDLAYAAKIMLSNRTNEMIESVNKIEDWNIISANVYGKILVNNIELPKRFYILSADDIQKISANIIKYEKLVLDIIKDNDNPKDIIFNYYLISYQIHVIDWENNQDRQYNDEIILKFINISDKLLKLYYNDNILCEEMIDVLPNIHAFSWLIIKYNQDKQNKNFEKCVYWLKKALKTLPDMNKMVKYLLDNVQNDIKKQEIPKEVAPELMMLAEKVKTILSQYPENDPAVLAIKQSDIYKKVVYLIEN